MNEISLDDVLTRIDRLRCGEAVAIFVPLADEVAAAHDVGAAHRAINRHTVRLAPDGTVSLVPSARARQRQAGARARADDVHALAVLLVDALLGRDGSGMPIDWAGRAFALGVPAGLVTVLSAALADSPVRCPTASELATALRETCDPLPLDRLLRGAQARA